MRGSRRAHRKSRSGCVECKRRRVKCDEGQPSCSLCVRFGIDCAYTPNVSKQLSQEPAVDSPARSFADSPAAGASRQSTAVSASPGSTTYPPPVSRPISPWFSPVQQQAQAEHNQSLTFSIKDMTLLHQWSTQTAHSIVKSQAGSMIWQVQITKIGLRYPFVLYGMLSLAALHCAFDSPSQRSNLLIDAAEYHNKALQGFRDALNMMSSSNSSTDVHEDKVTAVFISTLLNVPYVFAMYGPIHESPELAAEQSSARISRTLGAEWIPIMRGVQLLLRPNYDKIKNSSLAAMVTVPDWNDFDPDAQAQSEEDDRLRSLSETWASYSASDAEVYRETLHALRRCTAWASRFAAMREAGTLVEELYNHEWSSPFMWIHISPERYFGLLQQRQPPALLMFAYFGALLHQLDHYWWVRGWGRSVVGVVDEVLGPFWQSRMEWPKQAVATEVSMN